MRAVEQLERLKLTTVDAIAGDAVQAEVDMNTVLPTQGDGAVERLQGCIFDGHPVVLVGPCPVGAGQAGEIKSPLSHPVEIGLLIALATLGSRQFGEVESAPAWNGWMGSGNGGRRLGMNGTGQQA